MMPTALKNANTLNCQIRLADKTSISYFFFKVPDEEKKIPIVVKCSFKHKPALHHYRVKGESKRKDISVTQVRGSKDRELQVRTSHILDQQKEKAALPNSFDKGLLVSKQVSSGVSVVICRARRKHWVLQNAVEGTHRDLVQAVLTPNH